MVTKEKLLKQLEEWMDWLETPNDDFGGYPVCPFLAPERKTNQLLIVVCSRTTSSVAACMSIASMQIGCPFADSEIVMVDGKLIIVFLLMFNEF